jgi:hypothetical protein
MPVRNLPNTAKVREAVKGDVRHCARASVKSRRTGFMESRALPHRCDPSDCVKNCGEGFLGHNIKPMFSAKKGIATARARFSVYV